MTQENRSTVSRRTFITAMGAVAGVAGCAPLVSTAQDKPASPRG